MRYTTKKDCTEDKLLQIIEKPEYKQDEDDIFCLSLAAILWKIQDPQKKEYAKLQLQQSLHNCMYGPVANPQHPFIILTLSHMYVWQVRGSGTVPPPQVPDCGNYVHMDFFNQIWPVEIDAFDQIWPVEVYFKHVLVFISLLLVNRTRITVEVVNKVVSDIIGSCCRLISLLCKVFKGIIKYFGPIICDTSTNFIIWQCKDIVEYSACLNYCSDIVGI